MGPELQQKFDQWMADVIEFVPELLLIALILLITIVMSRRIQGIVRHVTGRTKAPPEIGDLLGRMARISVLLVGTLLVFGRLGLNDAVISFVAGLGIAGIVIGFALQDIVKQFAAGVLLLMLRPFRIGDEVKISGFEGRVVEIQLRATVLKTDEGDEVQIPNADVYTTAIVNKSRYNLRRRVVVLRAPATLDAERVRALLMQALEGTPGVAADPPPAIVGLDYDEKIMKIELRFWVDQRKHDRDAVATEVVSRARRALEQQGVEVEDEGAGDQSK
jgi:small conductance mechanosensitive channel